MQYFTQVCSYNADRSLFAAYWHSVGQGYCTNCKYLKIYWINKSLIIRKGKRMLDREIIQQTSTWTFFWMFPNSTSMIPRAFTVQHSEPRDAHVSLKVFSVADFFYRKTHRNNMNSCYRAKYYCLVVNFATAMYICVNIYVKVFFK